MDSDPTINRNMKTFRQFVNESLDPSELKSLASLKADIAGMDTPGRLDESYERAAQITAEILLGKPTGDSARLFDLGLLDDPYGDRLSEVLEVWNPNVHPDESVQESDLVERFPDLFEQDDFSLDHLESTEGETWDLYMHDSEQYGHFTVKSLMGSAGSRAVVWETYEGNYYWMLKKDLMG